MQKFTRPLTREIEVGGARLALTFSDQGMAVRLVGSRKQPWELSWNTLICHVTGQSPSGAEATADEVAKAVALLKKGAPSQTADDESAGEAGASSAQPASKPAATEASAATGKVGALLARLEKWLRAHRPRYLEGLLPGATAAELHALETSLGQRLPEDLRSLLRWHNGQSGDFVGHLENNWDLMNTSQIAAAKQDLDAGDPDQTGWQRTWVPCLDDNAGDYVVIDVAQPDGPVREFWQGQTEHPVIAPSLAAWLERFVSGVEHGAYHEDPERGTFSRQSRE